jgi:hypothetical protein
MKVADGSFQMRTHRVLGITQEGGLHMMILATWYEYSYLHTSCSP